ncbi:MAG: helix-turn-helix domain-containing protein [Mangrovibacterium sp.]
MNQRIRLILDYKRITAAEFANTIGVQPSNVSHVLNGRNNPSQIFIEKILSYYPEINARWLILGEGSMLDSSENAVLLNSSSRQAAKQIDLFDNEILPLDNISETTDNFIHNNNKTMETTDNRTSTSIIETPCIRKVARIVTFYSDQTFEEFYPK